MSHQNHRSKTIFVAVISLLLYFFGVAPASAVYDPNTQPNNKFGVHILETSEIFKAQKLVNSSDGLWGYVTVVIRSNDRDKNKWTEFMRNAKSQNIIPIVRIATYPEDGAWAKPTPYDLVDFANFLNDLPWPTKNRYVALFNEPNHSGEWGGEIRPDEYAAMLIDAKKVFKSKSSDFFLLTGGLDMSAPNSRTSMDALVFTKQMTKFLPGWYESVDGLSFHAYANPAFSSSALSTSRYGIQSYKYEIKELSKMGFGIKPFIIKETGYVGSEDFYNHAFNNVWTEKELFAITPFTLYSASGPFEKFSLLNKDFSPKPLYNQIFTLPKKTGSPLLATPETYPMDNSNSNPKPNSQDNSKDIFSRLKNLVVAKKNTVVINNKVINVEIAKTKQQLERGLSYRKNLEEDSGMLFVFDSKRITTFWMYEMQLDLDFIWIEDGKVVDIHQNVKAPKNNGWKMEFITPQTPSDHILEVNAGFVKKNDIKIGDEVRYNF